ncbi:MAG: CARDB domain-containing protein, partial [Nanoarchaeota archaeon]|nr:CARDB domain-containing protein [Nanoarchaeota archaeon]
STNSLKYRKDNILTNIYSNYEEGFSLLGINDSKTGNKLKVNATVSSSLNGTFQSLLFLRHNSSTIYSKQNFQFIKGENHLVFELDNDTIKNTHYNGKYNLSSLKIGGKTIKADYTTSAYNFRDFAASSYIYGFADGKFDSDADNNYDELQINATIHAFSANIYNLKISLYDLFGNIVEIKNTSATLNSGNQTISININGTKIYNKKLNGPFAIKNIELYENYILADKINDAYTTSNYNFNDFSASLPDIITSISVSEGYHYGANNITVNVTLKNSGSKPAFNVFFDIFDNNTLFKTNKSNIILKNAEVFYQLNFTNASDFEISAIADLQGIVDEINESNNAEKITIKINRKPALLQISNITANETDNIVLNLSASDPNEDRIIYSVNLSKFSNQSNIFRWQTTTMDSGNYTIAAAASDGYLNDSIIFNVVVIDVPDKDSDNDGINDTIDKVIGNENSINTSTMNLRLFINSSDNLSRLFDKQATVAFMDGNLTIAELEFDFLNYRLNLTNITIDKQASNSTGSLIFRGLSMPAGMTKILYVDKLNTAINGICVKDDEITSISEISGNCDSSNEFKIECDGTAQNSYKCTYNSSLSKYKVEGLKHSGITQFSYSKPS